MKICMLIERFPPVFSGAARQALQLAPQLRERGVDLFFLVSQIEPATPRQDSVDGFRVCRVPFSTGSKLRRLRGLLGLCRALSQERANYDILHLHGAYYVTLAAACYARTFLGKRVVIKMTSINFDTPGAVRQRKYGAVSWWLYRRATAYVCMTSAQVDDCRNHGLPGARVHKIPNGVDVERFRPPALPGERAQLLTRLGLPADCRYGVFIGTIERDKGVELLVDAAASVCAAQSDVAFLLIGPDGSAAGEHHVDPVFVASLREKIRAAGLDKRIRLLGQKPNADEYLRAATFFVFPSRSEGFGTVLIEAMATGLPCIALHIPGVTTDIITSGSNGIIVEQEKAGDFATEILDVLRDPARARELGAAALSTVLDRFQMAAIATEYKRLYQSLAADESV